MYEKELFENLKLLTFVSINIDSTILLQKPQISNYIDEMKQNISNIFSIPINKISIKSTTTDQLGFIGNEQGIAATSIVMLANCNES